MGLDDEFSELQRENDRKRINDEREFRQFQEMKRRNELNRFENQNLNSLYTPPAKLPNATAVLVLGICSIVGCFMWGIPGLICSIIALSLHKRDVIVYNANPTRFEHSFQQSRSGKTCAIIGLSLSCVMFLFLIIYFLFIISIFSNLPIH